MRIVAVSPYPPSDLPHSGFAAHAVRGFLADPDVCQVTVLADMLDAPVCGSEPRLVVDRCWRYDALGTLPVILGRVRRHRADVVWLNLFYTTFGNRPIVIVWTLLLPLLLRRLGYPVVTLLHNFLAAVDIDRTGRSFSPLLRRAMALTDVLVMKSLMSSSRTMVMTQAYERMLRSTYDGVSVEYVEQDLFRVQADWTSPRGSQVILCIGYFGTHKRLETLIQAFQQVRQRLRAARLVIVGADHPSSPGYLASIRSRYSAQLEGITFRGYVPEDGLTAVFEEADVVVMTNVADTGSSGVLRYAARCGRAVVAPALPSYLAYAADGWGVVYYAPGDVASLADVLSALLADPAWVRELGQRNDQRARRTGDQFVRQHLRAFKMLAR